MEWIELKKEGPATIVIMNHASDNTFSGPFTDEIMSALDALEADLEVRAVVFTGGVDKYFSNGLNLGWIASQPREEVVRFLINFNGMLRRVLIFPKPVVAAINGHAFAGGFFLACCMDFRFMRRDRGWMCVPEVDLGLTLPPGTVALLESVMGAGKLNELALTGKRITGPEAKEMGVVHEVYDRDELLDKAVGFAKQVALKRPENYAKVKAALRARVARIMEQEDAEMIRQEVRKTLDGK